MKRIKKQKLKHQGDIAAVHLNLRADENIELDYNCRPRVSRCALPACEGDAQTAGMGETCASMSIASFCAKLMNGAGSPSSRAADAFRMEDALPARV